MLASITPLGERGRGSKWGLTLIAFTVGATISAVAEGAVLGGLGGLVLPAGVGPRTRLVVLASALLVALALDLRPAGAPGPRRQVNERWLDEFRGWVYGLGFGAQLGAGIGTVVSSAATYAALLAALLAASPARGGLILGCFGAVRGLTLLAAAHVRRPDQLVAFHSRLQNWHAPAARLTRTGIAALGALAIFGALT
jgi:sulfite exporter TauE/SafE